MFWKVCSPWQSGYPFTLVMSDVAGLLFLATLRLPSFLLLPLAIPHFSSSPTSLSSSPFSPLVVPPHFISSLLLPSLPSPLHSLCLRTNSAIIHQVLPTVRHFLYFSFLLLLFFFLLIYLFQLFFILFFSSREQKMEWEVEEEVKSIGIALYFSRLFFSFFFFVCIERRKIFSNQILVFWWKEGTLKSLSTALKIDFRFSSPSRKSVAINEFILFFYIH